MEVVEQQLSALRRALRTEPNVRLAVLCGSVARGDDRPDSDLDVLVSVGEATRSTTRWWCRRWTH